VRALKLSATHSNCTRALIGIVPGVLTGIPIRAGLTVGLDILLSQRVCLVLHNPITNGTRHYDALSIVGV
jgi:hypothetical protein